MSPPVSPLDTTDCEAEPLALSPRSSGTNIRTSPEACSHEVPGLRTFLFTVCRIYARTLTSTPLCCVSVFV